MRAWPLMLIALLGLAGCAGPEETIAPSDGDGGLTDCEVLPREPTPAGKKETAECEVVVDEQVRAHMHAG